MTVTFISGVESGHALSSGFGTPAGSAAASSVQKRTGSFAMRVNPGSGASGSFGPQNGLGTSLLAYTHFGLYIASMPTATRAILGNLNIGEAQLKLTSAGKLQYTVNNTQQGSDSVTTLTTGVWYWIGVRRFTGSSVSLVQINGVDEISGSPTITGAAGTIGCLGTEASAIDIYFDDFIIGDSALGFLPPSKVVTLFPISDNARATLWTAGAGATTSLFDAVNNAPPVGVAGGTNTSQIEHAGGAAGTTDAYDANMTSYTTAGIGASDTILAIQYQISCGEDAATGTKLLNFSLVSNPAQASGLSNFDVNVSSGAVGTYPTGWTAQINTLIQSPSVTRGTSPVMRVVRPETATRVASVAYMGMEVAYTPFVPGDNPPTRVPYYPQLLAH